MNVIQMSDFLELFQTLTLDFGRIAGPANCHAAVECNQDDPWQHYGWLETPLTHNVFFFTTNNSNGHLPFFYGSFKCLIGLLDSQRSEKWKELEQERFDNAPIEGYNIPT